MVYNNPISSFGSTAPRIAQDSNGNPWTGLSDFNLRLVLALAKVPNESNSAYTYEIVLIISSILDTQADKKMIKQYSKDQDIL